MGARACNDDGVFLLGKYRECLFRGMIPSVNLQPKGVAGIGLDIRVPGARFRRRGQFCWPSPSPPPTLATAVIKLTTDDETSIRDLVEVAKVWRFYSQKPPPFLSATASGRRWLAG